ncbi:MAG: hypothetical protein GW859_08530 [Sphingomonadales bacterium]|nr:hypothetical protein [Sphingomonadales bacterium]
MLDMREDIEICSFECTFCQPCVIKLGAALERHPASIERRHCP